MSFIDTFFPYLSYFVWNTACISSAFSRLSNVPKTVLLYLTNKAFSNNAHSRGTGLLTQIMPPLTEWILKTNLKAIYRIFRIEVFFPLCSWVTTDAFSFFLSPLFIQGSTLRASSLFQVRPDDNTYKTYCTSIENTTVSNWIITGYTKQVQTLCGSVSSRHALNVSI